MKQHILVIDDDELVRSGLVADLSREGFQVSAAAGGEQGLAMLALNPADLVLCDLVLGDMDGIEVLRRIKAQWPDTAVVMITGHATIRNALDALRSGASDYIAKPADPEEVTHRLRTVLNAEYLRRSLAAERGRAEARRRETQELLIRSERMASLGLLASSAAEDLANLLLPILEHSTALRETLGEGHAGLPLIQSIEEAAGRAAEMLEDLKAIGSGIRYQASTIQLNQLLDRYLNADEFNRLKAQLPMVRVDLHCDPTVPPIRGSSESLTRAIGHLLAFAFESVAGGGMVRVDTRVEHMEHPVGRYGSGAPGDYVVLAITDTAPPLSSEALERLFEPFYVRAALGRRLVSGLGMALVHRVVADHGGFIDVRPAAGKGNTCLVYLPVAALDGNEVLDLKPDYTGHERILVVDDYEEHRHTASDILRDLGYDVITASSGREAVRLFESLLRKHERPVDLLVIDLVLGDEFDGVETYKEILAIKPGQPAILVSGFADIARIVEARKLGIRQSIQKPYNAETLGAAIRAALD